MPEPSFGWSFLSRDALAAAKIQLDGEAAGVRDEIGFLQFHQRYADRFFPGTSVLHSRPRYALFVPWHFKDLQGRAGEAGRARLKVAETELAGRLKDARQRNVIGVNTYPQPAAQPPSTVYWNALSMWGIVRPSPRGNVLSRPQVMAMLNAGRSTLDEDAEPISDVFEPFAALPKPPADWTQKGPITFALTGDEATFLREKLSTLHVQSRTGSGSLSLLAKLVRKGINPPVVPWAPAVFRIAGSDGGALERAKQLAALAAVGRGVYAALVEDLRERGDGRATDPIHRDNLSEVIAQYSSDARAIDLDLVEGDIGPLPTALRRVCEETLKWLAAGTTSPRSLLDVYAAAEHRKGPKARLALTVNGRERRIEWDPNLHTKALPLHYRWDQVRMLLQDLRVAS